VVTEKLQAVLGASDITTVHENAAYGFTLKLLSSKARKFNLLYTEGLSQKEQPVDEKNQQLKRLELYFLLPDYWDLSKKKWPVDWLNRIAQVPQKNKTWFGTGDTLPAGNPPEYVDPQLKCSYFILSEPILLGHELRGDQWHDANFSMLAVIPIFKREFDYKSQNSSKALLQIFKEKGVTEMIDTYRDPVARKRFMGLF